MGSCSNSLIIHQVQQRNWQPWRRFGYTILTILLLRLLRGFCFIKRIYQILETVFHRISKHLEFRQIYYTARRIINSLVGVWIFRWDSLVFVPLLQTRKTTAMFDHVSKHRKESARSKLIRRTAKYFWQTARHLEMWLNTVLSIWYTLFFLYKNI